MSKTLTEPDPELPENGTLVIMNHDFEKTTLYKFLNICIDSCKRSLNFWCLFDNMELYDKALFTYTDDISFISFKLMAEQIRQQLYSSGNN